MKRFACLILVFALFLSLPSNAVTQEYQNITIDGVSWSWEQLTWDCYTFAFQHVYENLTTTQKANWGLPCEYYNKVSSDFAALGNNYYPSIDYRTASLTTLANGMVMELQFLGYYATYTTFVPDLSALHSDEYLVCFRRISSGWDQYHLMRYEQSAGAWWQKFPSFWPTQFTATMSNSVAWKHEGSAGSGVTLISDTVYDSSIIYILYSHTDYYNNWESR